MRVAGIPGLLGYRAVNTLDAMIGHRSPRYERFGWSAARLDDLANWVPARVAGLAAALAAPLVGGSPQRVLRVVRRDAGQHPSPNAGVVEAAFAGALGIRLGGRNVYRGQVEERGVLGDGPAAAAADIPRANRLAAAVSLLALTLAVILRLTLPIVGGSGGHDDPDPRWHGRGPDAGGRAGRHRSGRADLTGRPGTRNPPCPPAGCGSVASAGPDGLAAVPADDPRSAR